MSRRLRSRPLIIAHRGASAVAPEGTRAAIRAAVRAGADMVELDVQMTRDGRLVAFHDDRLERTTNGAGRVSDVPYARFARLDAGSWFHARFADERPLLVSQVLRLTPRRMGINLELKRTPRRRALLQRLLRVVGGGVHPPSPEAPGVSQGRKARRVLLRSRADKATAKQNMASERFRPTGPKRGHGRQPVGLHSIT
mgnify:CR=1 FL=1